MNKRVEQKRKQDQALRSMLRKALAVLFCISLLVLAINITDMSTRKMILCNDDKYAMSVSLQEDNQLRLDIAGEKFMVNIEPAAKVTEYIVSNYKRYCDKLLKTVRSEKEE